MAMQILGRPVALGFAEPRAFAEDDECDILHDAWPQGRARKQHNTGGPGAGTENRDWGLRRGADANGLACREQTVLSWMPGDAGWWWGLRRGPYLAVPLWPWPRCRGGRLSSDYRLREIRGRRNRFGQVS